MSVLLKKARTALRIGPAAAARVLEERTRGRRERFALAIGRHKWPSEAAVGRSLAPGATLAQVASGPAAQWFLSGPARDSERLKAALGDRECRALLARADLYCEHVFDFLGSGPTRLGERIDWSRDFKSGYRWDSRYMGDLCLVDLSNDADVKVPWELSRHQHFVTLGQAYVLTGDEKYAREFVAQLTDWMDANPPMIGVTWACTMDVALRAVSWTWAWHLFAKSDAFDEATRRRFLAGILAHGRFIMSHLEWGDIRGNHYLSDGAGLAVIGLAFPEFKEARGWRDKGFEIVWGELPQQVLPDGVDFEMSTSYQRLVLELFITPTLFAKRRGVEVPAAAWERIERALEFVMAATRPDGEIALFGDADDGRCQILSEETRLRINDHRYLLALGAALFGRTDMKAASGGWHAELDWLLAAEDRDAYEKLESLADSSAKAFADGGFYVMRGGGTWMMVDCGPVGLAGLGGHGHNDALSFELCVGGTPVIVDAGTYVYTSDIDARNELRSTHAHNLVVVDGTEMADLGPDAWAIADQAKAEVVEWVPDNSVQALEGIHHGYERLPEPVAVRRRFELDADSGTVVIRDWLEGVGTHDVEMRFHTPHPASLDENGRVTVHAGGVDVRFALDGAAAQTARPFSEETWLSPSYGLRHRGTCFGWRWSGCRMPWDARVNVERCEERVL